MQNITNTLSVSSKFARISEIILKNKKYSELLHFFSSMNDNEF